LCYEGNVEECITVFAKIKKIRTPKESPTQLVENVAGSV
jgi:hypothetical protein